MTEVFPFAIVRIKLVSRRTTNMKIRSKRSLALLLISALLAGILPLSGSAPVQAAGHGLDNPTTDADGITT